MADMSPERPPPTNIESTKSVQPGQEQKAPGDAFKSYMEGGEQPQKAAGKSEGMTPFDLAGQGALSSTGPTHDSLLGQMNSASSVLGDLQTQLHKKNLNLKQSQKYLLRQKLTNANDHIRGAAKKAGVDVGDPPQTSARQSPIAKFIGLITDGQQQLTKTQDMIQNMKMSPDGGLNPGAMLTIQVKLAKAQQELEYSSILLSKAVDDIKTLFNIQL